MRIPKNTVHNLAGRTLCLWALRLAITRLQLLCRLFIGFGCVIMDPCFINCHGLTQKFLLITLKKVKAHSELSTCCCFRSIVRERDTHRSDSFFLPKCSCEIWRTMEKMFHNIYQDISWLGYYFLPLKSNV